MNITDLMTPDPATCTRQTTLADAAATMRDQSIGDVLVSDDDGSVSGIVTDRDLVVRALAAGLGPTSTIGSICSGELRTVSADSEIADVVALMEQHTLRRVPIERDGSIIGIVSLGDLAASLDSESALGKISASAPNR